jgi:hypothetical protein
MISQELIKQVLEPDPENEDLKFDESNYLEVQKEGKPCCPFCGNKLQERKDAWVKDKLSRFRCQSKPCENYRKQQNLKLIDFL